MLIGCTARGSRDSGAAIPDKVNTNLIAFASAVVKNQPGLSRCDQPDENWVAAVPHGTAAVTSGN